MVSLFYGFFVLWCMVLRFYGFMVFGFWLLVLWFYGCVVVWFYGFLVVWCTVLGFCGFMVLWFYGLWFYSFMVLWFLSCKSLPTFHFMFSRRYLSHIHDFKDFIIRIVGLFRRPSFLEMATNEFPKC